jgi:hypothetical protein
MDRDTVFGLVIIVIFSIILFAMGKAALSFLLDHWLAVLAILIAIAALIVYVGKSKKHS